MIRNTRGEVLVLTHRRELLGQHEKLFRDLNITNARVSMILTEVNRLGQHATPALIVTDEAHLSRSNSWVKVLEYYNTVTVGFTATPCRMDSRPLNDVYDILIEGVDVKWLIDHNRLAPYEYYAPTLVDTSGLRVVRGDYVTADLDQLMNERAIYGDVVRTYERLAPGEKAIAYCVSVSHARRTADAFNQAGIRAEAISAETPGRERERIMADFRSGEIRVVCNVNVIAEGISITDVSCVLLVRPTESVSLGLQMAQRCMRYQPGKTAKILDFVGNYLRVGQPADPRVWSLDKPVSKRRQLNENGDFYIRSCPECFMVFQTAPVCPYCGHEYPLHPREIQAHQDIELQRITAEEAERVEAAKKADRMEQGRAQTFEDLVRLGKQRGYKNPAFWAAQVLRGRRR